MIAFREILSRLTGSGVEFIVVGGIAATVHGSARATYDLDVVYRRTRDNAGRLAAALAPLNPYLRGAIPNLPFRLDEETICRGLNFTLTTPLGDLDLLGDVNGGYDELRENALEIELFGVNCLCVSLEKLIEMKRRAGRPKDFEVIAELEALRDERGDKEM